jgi:catechol 2,3-dioxygenase-like lactoylglutathione lyase family enzyme
LSLRSFTHLALRVEGLREAEAFYRELFLLEVAFREAETPEGWRTLAPEADWADAEAAGVELGLVMLYRDGFRLALKALIGYRRRVGSRTWVSTPTSQSLTGCMSEPGGLAARWLRSTLSGR